jgi:hypothetical protein
MDLIFLHGIQMSHGDQTLLCVSGVMTMQIGAKLIVEIMGAISLSHQVAICRHSIFAEIIESIRCSRALLPLLFMAVQVQMLLTIILVPLSIMERVIISP